MTIEPMIEKLHLEDLHNILHPSTFDENNDYDLLIVRLPVINETLSSRSLGFIFTPDKSYYYNSEENTFEPLDHKFEGPYHKIDHILDQLLKAFNEYQDQISDMEELLYEDEAKTNFMNQWLSLKKDILRVERIMHRTSNIMQEVINHYENIENFPVNHYVDIHEHCERILRASTMQLSKLDYLYNFYNTRTNEKMNRLIFILTIISAIFLPLNLIVGFFGMNTSGLPFTSGSNGTLNVISGLLFLIVLTSVTVFLWQKKIEKSQD